jgi:predicted DNA-binding WGR domain protein
MEAGDKPDFIPLDVVVKNEKQYKVYYDEERRPFDCYLTKVDLANGLYGAYVFYKIQMLYDTNRDLYIVLTRYGRIGETGMNQRSPFNNVDDAIADFSTIFKQKTGNDWASAHLNFTKMPKKYNLVQVHHSRVKH